MFSLYLGLLLLLIELPLVCFFYIIFQNPYLIWARLKFLISAETALQNQEGLITPDIPSLHDATKSSNLAIKKLGNFLKTNFSQIQKEVLTLCSNKPNNCFVIPMAQIDNEQYEFLKQSKAVHSDSFESTNTWNSIWLKFYAPTSSFILFNNEKDNYCLRVLQENRYKFPKLFELCTTCAHPRILLAQISILEPGARLVPHQGPNAAVYRIHCGIKIPKPESLDQTYPPCHLRLYSPQGKTSIYYWQENVTVAWDDTIIHSAVNESQTQRRIILFFDVARNFSGIKGMICDFINWGLTFNWITCRVRQRMESSMLDNKYSAIISRLVALPDRPSIKDSYWHFLSISFYIRIIVALF